MTFFEQLGQQILFLLKIIKALKQGRFRVHDVLEQTWLISVHSWATTAFSGFFVGGILCVQFTLQLKEFDALGYLGGLSTSGTMREVGPLLIAFLLAGKVGAFAAAEIGTLKVTDQIDALRCLGADPFQEILIPRFIGLVVASFFLLWLGLITSVLGGMTMAKIFAGVNPTEYIRHIPTLLTGFSVASGATKSILFSVVIATICLFRGISTTGGARGVGQSVVKTAVESMLTLVTMDWISSVFLAAIAKSLGAIG